MKNITTLSLITVAILAINGCGGGNSSSSNEKVTSIQKLSNASTKHTKAEWNALEDEIQSLEKTALFNTVLLESIEKNVANLTYVGLDKEVAYATNSDTMYDDLTDLDLGDFDNQVLQECKEDESCKEMAYDTLDSIFTIDKEVAYVMATGIRGEGHAFVNDQLVKEFTCASGEVKTVQHYGIEDLFSTTNGVEATSQNPTDIKQDMIDYNNNVHAGFANYDETHNNRLFLDDIKNLPAGITKGRLYIGLKSNGSSLQVNDTLSFGELSTNDRYAKALTDLQGDGWHEDLVNSSNPTTAIYSSDFRDIPLNMHSGSTDTLLTLAKTNQRFGAYVQDDTSVDFITVATCSKPNPIKEITDIVNKFECSEKEQLIKIMGGEIDAFSPTADNPAAHPSNHLLTTNTYGSISNYDQTNVNKALLDTLDLSQVSGTVTKAEFHIGYKSLGNPLTGNDTVAIGQYGTEHIGGRYLLYPNGTNPLTPTPWVPHTVSGGEQLLSVDLANTTSNVTTSLNMLNWIQGKSEFDVKVEDDTAVDFTQLNLCVKDNCDENAKNIDLNLSKLTSWTNRPADAIENNVFNGTQYQGVWDDTINWFDFTNSHSDEMLEIPFCACGNTIVNINNLKADNSATIKLDGTLVASQTANDQAAMKRDDMGGVHEDGSLTIPAGTNGGTNHVLRVNVHNLGSEFGVAIDGTLKFKGNLGKCTK